MIILSCIKTSNCVFISVNFRLESSEIVSEDSKNSLKFPSNCHLSTKFDEMVLNEELKTLSALELLKSFRSILTDWKNKTPNQKFCYFYSSAKIMLKPIGLPLFEDDQTIHWYSYSSYAVVGVYAILSMYTAYYHGMHGEPEKWLPSTCLLIIIFCVS